MRVYSRTLLSVVVLAVAAVCGPGAGGESASPAEQEQPAAQEEKTPYADEVSPELRRVLDNLDEANAKVEDLTADIEYSREITLLDEREECKGTLEFKKPYLIHLNLGKPLKKEVYTDGRWWWLVMHKDKQVEIYPVERPEGAPSEAAGEKGGEADQVPRVENAMTEASFMDFGYGKRSEKLLKDYKITLVDQKRETKGRKKEVVICYRLRFVPRREDAPARFSGIEVEVADDLWLPRLIVLEESEGQIVQRFRLKNIKLNRKLKAERFTYKPKRGYNVERPLEQ